MFGRTVTIDGHEVHVSCLPGTPLSEVLRRAAAIMEGREEKARAESPTGQAYRRAVERLGSAD
jgi:aerobic-type carbon monoxide dehydrogenase small subunit (CoxS/CutS family)